MVIQGIQGNKTQKLPQTTQFKGNSKPQPITTQNIDGLKALAFLGTKNFISFGAITPKFPDSTVMGLNLNSQTKLSDEMINKIRFIASKQIVSKPKWNIETPNVWMVTGETRTFMKTGGLADVGVDLPEAFNKQYNSSGAKMTIVQPLYLTDGLVTLTDNGDNTYTYTSKPLKNSIKLEKTGEIIRVPTGKDGEVANVEVLKGYHAPTHTEYRFLKCDKYFGELPNNGQKANPYVVNNNGIGEQERFAFLSKAVANYIQDLTEKGSPDAPNVIDSNDWHVAPLAGLLKYLAPAKASKGEISQDTADKVAKLPIVYTVHNMEYQGWGNEKTTQLLNFLYEGYTDSIFNSAYAPFMDDDKKSLTIRRTYNASLNSLALADAVVPVSPNYAKEIASKDFILEVPRKPQEKNYFGWDFVEMLQARQQGGSMQGIVNGINNDEISPDGSNAKIIFKQFPEFKEYNKNMTPSNIAKIKLDNKRAFIQLLQQDTFNDRLKLTPTGNITLKNFDMSKLAKTPIISAVGRLDGQKGSQFMAESIKNALEAPIPPGEEKPLVFILGSGSGDEDLTEMMGKLSPENKERVVFFNAYSPELMFLTQIVGDVCVMPSKFEPCGLVQLQAMIKGNLPVATATGGLVDTIEDGKTGFLSEYTPDNPANTQNKFNAALMRSINLFRNDRAQFEEMAWNAMQKDFSWENSGSLEQYMNLFKTGDIKKAA